MPGRSWGVKEVVITNGSKGSTIYSEGTFYTIPAYRPQTIIDATLAAATFYMVGYTCAQRRKRHQHTTIRAISPPPWQ